MYLPAHSEDAQMVSTVTVHREKADAEEARALRRRVADRRESSLAVATLRARRGLDHMAALVVGSGAREHAILAALARAKSRPSLLCFGSANNPGIAALCKATKPGGKCEKGWRTCMNEKCVKKEVLDT